MCIRGPDAPAMLDVKEVYNIFLWEQAVHLVSVLSFMSLCMQLVSTKKTVIQRQIMDISLDFIVLALK